MECDKRASATKNEAKVVQELLQNNSYQKLCFLISIFLKKNDRAIKINKLEVREL